MKKILYVTLVLMFAVASMLSVLPTPVSAADPVETLRPNAVGDLDELRGAGWEAVDEDSADNETSMVWWGVPTDTGNKRDLYHIPDHSEGSGVIHNIIIYARSKGENHFYPYRGHGYIILKTEGVVYASGYKGCESEGVWYNWSETWSTNPNTGNPWTWPEIDALQIGVELSGNWLSGYRHETYCTQVYVEVDYTAAITPIIVTNAATVVAYSTARLHSTLTFDGGEPCDVRFQYYKDGEAAWDEDTTWVTGYTTGQQPYVDLTGLTNDTLYHFRVQAENSIASANGASLDFTTAATVGEPTAFKAFPEGERVVLSWIKGSGATNTLVRYKEGTYPTATTDGTQVYLGKLGDNVHTGLSPGHTYYYSAWGESGGNYSDGYATVMATTLPGAVEGTTPGTPTMPPNWFQTPDYSAFVALPFYDIINAFYDAYEMPRASGWFFSTIIGCIVFAIFVFVVSRHPMPTMIALAVALALTSLIKLLPMWMMLFAVVFMLGAFQLGRSR